MTTDAAPAFEVAEPEESFGTRLWENIKGGNLGSAPVIAGLTIIVIVFAFTAQNFFTAVNFNNIITQMAGTTMLAFGVVFVLLLGEIDLSIAYLSGLAGVIVAELQKSGSGHVLPGILPIIAAVALATVIGAFQGSFVALIGVPAFVVTLAGLLAWQGVIQVTLGAGGPIIIDNRWVNYTESYFFSNLAGWLIWGLLSVAYVGSVAFGVLSKRSHGVAIRHPYLLAAKTIGVPAIAALAVAICNHDRGVPLAGLEIVFFLLLLDVHHQAHDIRPSRLRGRRQPGGGASRRHQRPAHSHHRVRDLGLHGGSRRHSARGERPLGRAGPGRRHAAARCDRGSGDRRHEPVRRPRRGAQRRTRRGRDLDDRERPLHLRLPARRDLHHDRLDPALRRHARHGRAPAPGEDRALVVLLSGRPRQE